ncbi:hypothetical protein [Arachidicoccus terrestris]|uniref:hypothetical protein n=1 Tax=Arachidicoccus terrestris TaxID=2875539 RepID=UPI001CC745A1|nr:hypothetical protein [Arachidicoccus terrestris]UAY56051.1 hypothetical protein K9M52_03200 [Arachidicoccus terrestris]
MKAIVLKCQYVSQRSLLLLSAIALSFFCAPHARSQQKRITSRYQVAPSPQWTQLFTRQTGWTGGDGIYSIRLPKDFNNPYINPEKDNILFLFSDSVIDTLINNQPSENGWTMIHNAVAVLNGTTPKPDALHFHWPESEDGKPASVFIPAGQSAQPGKPKDDSIYYWLGDGIALSDNNKNAGHQKAALAIFAYKMINYSPEPFGFKDIANELLLTDSHFEILRRIEIPMLAKGNFGAGIYKDTINNPSDHTPYIYIYGVRGSHKGLVIARTTEKELTAPEKWQYYSDAGWSTDMHRSIDVTAHVSNELSVTRTPDGQYALIFQLDGIQPYIGMKLAPTPYGPFGPTDTLWHCEEPDATNKLLVYNAKAHPSISPSGTLLISYNVNSLAFIKTLKEEPTFYRPRFLLLKWK